MGNICACRLYTLHPISLKVNRTIMYTLMDDYDYIISSY